MHLGHPQNQAIAASLKKAGKSYYKDAAEGYIYSYHDACRRGDSASMSVARGRLIKR